ncbi:MAG: DNA methyltransferase [Dehalococcoidia bacterium]
MRNEPHQDRITKRRANDLDGKTWQRHSISLWSDLRKTPEEVSLKHPASFPLELVIRLMQCFTNREDRLVLDPFCGIGTTPIAAELMGKTGIGIELSQEFCQRALGRQPTLHTESDELGNPVPTLSRGGVALAPELGRRQIICDDARNLLQHVGPESVDLVVTSPPYWDILLQRRSADHKEVRHYGADTEDLGKIEEYEDFLQGLKEVFGPVYTALRPGKFCLVIVMDLRKRSRFFPLHSDVATLLQELGFIYDDLIIWDRRHEYNNMRPLGYPYRFRVNKAHEYILIFQKPAGS